MPVSKKTDIIKINDRDTLIINPEVYDAIGFADKAVANVGRTFDNVLTGVTVKSDYGKQDYDYYRPSSFVPHTPEEMMNAAMLVYKKVGIVHNIIDLMSELGCKGIKLVHEDKSIEKFYQSWFDYVSGPMVSERFYNYLYRIANVCVHRANGKVPITFQRRWSKVAAEESVQDPEVSFKRIPLRYSFINPTNIEVIAPQISVFVGKQMYALRMGNAFASALSKLQNDYKGISIKELTDLIPDFILKAIKTGSKLLPLTEDDISVYHYKKDDWDVWATPMIYSIMDDIVELQKLKLADISALDGAISNIRLWRIGIIGDSPATTILPTKSAMDRLRSLLSNNVGGGTMDLVMGPEVDFKESNTQVHKFLGMEKYEPTLKAISDGLGVPSSMGSGGKGYHDNFISMQTFIERLNYGRSVLTRFWNTEIKRVQLAMGFDKPAIVSYDQISLGDDSAIKNLIVGLVDRGIISEEDILDNFDFIPDVVRSRIKREMEDRKSGALNPKAGPFHNAQVQEDLKKIILQAGGVTPEEVGLQLDERKAGTKSMKEMDLEVQKQKITTQKYKPGAKNGRPKNKKDSVKRKTRVEKVKSEFVTRFMWANEAQTKIHSNLLPAIQELYGKNDVRKLTKAESEKFETIKFLVLSNLQPLQNVDKDVVLDNMNKYEINTDIVKLAQGLAGKFFILNNRQPNLDEMRQIQASAYCLFHEDNSKSNESDFDL